MPFKADISVVRCVVSLFAVGGVVACGGGGSNNGSNGANSSTLVTSVPAPTYGAGSDRLMAFNAINANRSSCGFGLLAQNASLDLAAQNHAVYLDKNFVSGHYETSGNPYFYGADPAARATQAGYSYGRLGEAVSGRNAAEGAIKNLFAAPYHAIGLLSGCRDMGVGFSVGYTVVDSGLAPGLDFQWNDADQRTFPCEGFANAVADISNEVPSPFPDAPDQHWGQPILITSKHVTGGSLKISTVSIKSPVADVAVLKIYGDGNASDPNGHFGAGWSVVIPAALQANTTYTVVLTGTDTGVPFQKIFKFKTST